jgi:hypothetical protein
MSVPCSVVTNGMQALSPHMLRARNALTACGIA